MSFLERKIEAILFASAKPVRLVQLGKLLQVDQTVLRQALDALKQKRNQEDSGIHILEQEGSVQCVATSQEAPLIQSFLQQEIQGELTKPSLETLTVIAYLGPITKPELESVRGVNCSLILRNLLLRGLIVETEDTKKLQSVYFVSLDFLQHIGLHDVEELPDYQKLHHHEEIHKLFFGQEV